MSVVFHALVGAAIAHVASTRTRGRSPSLALVGATAALSMLSHGVLDGLKHGYPLSPAVDVLAGAMVAVLWCALVRRSLRVLFAVTLAASFAPDVIDHVPPILRYNMGLQVPLNPLGPLFPWHWVDGSGSMHHGASRRWLDLDAGGNGGVSLANHLVVVMLALGGIATAPGAFRFMRRSDEPETARVRAGLPPPING